MRKLSLNWYIQFEITCGLAACREAATSFATQSMDKSNKNLNNRVQTDPVYANIYAIDRPRVPIHVNSKIAHSSLKQQKKEVNTKTAERHKIKKTP